MVTFLFPVYIVKGMTKQMNKEQYRLLEKFLEGKCTDSELATVKKILDTEEGKLVLSEIMESSDRLAEMIDTEQGT